MRDGELEFEKIHDVFRPAQCLLCSMKCHNRRRPNPSGAFSGGEPAPEGVFLSQMGRDTLQSIASEMKQGNVEK